MALSETAGFFAETIWNHPQNSDLREKRKFLNVLAPGDVVYIPDKEPKSLGCDTEKRHRFRRKGIPAMFRLRLCINNQPYAGKRYTLTVNGVDYSGVTDAQGRLHQHLPAGATKGELLTEDLMAIQLEFSTLGPVGEIAGVQNRLNNLGFDCGSADGQLNQRTRDAIRRLQASLNLEETGELDDAIRKHLENLHDQAAESLSE